MPRNQAPGIHAALLCALLAAAPAAARAADADDDAPAPAPLPKAPPPAPGAAPVDPPDAPPIARAVPVETASDHWSFFTTGRIGTFFSYSRGDGMPQATTYDLATDTPRHQVKIGAGGTGQVSQEARPALRPDGTPSASALVSSIDSMRVRSGFTGNILGFGARRQIGDTTVTAYVSVTAIVDSQAQKKYFQSLPDVREGYVRAEGAWGALLAGRSGVLFDRGDVETDFLYLHGFGLGFPADLNSSAAFPTAGQIGFGVLANGYAAGFVYQTPDLAGVRLSLGLYDPASLTGSSIERTKWLRPELELLVHEPLGQLGFIHLYANGGVQANYQQNKPDDVVKYMYGIGYGGRVELGPVHLGGGGHWGRGLGLTYPGLLSDAVYDEASTLRYTDGYFGVAQLALGRFDLNAGYGITKIRMTNLDLTADPLSAFGDPTNSVIRSQAAFSGAVVYHARRWLHFDVDYMNAESKWDLGERQRVNFVNAGTTVTW